MSIARFLIAVCDRYRGIPSFLSRSLLVQQCLPSGPENQAKNQASDPNPMVG
jgi:hypothetical protein